MLFPNNARSVSIVLFVGAALIAGCGPGKPDPILQERPAPARVGGAIPVTPVEGPLDIASFRVNPCGSLKREDIAALISDPPDRANPGSAYSAPTGCAWGIWDGPQLRVQLPAGKEKTLTDLVELNERDPGLRPGWRELSIGGLPAVQYHLSGDMKSCGLSVGVSDEAALEFDYRVPGETGSQYWGTDRCAGALKAAEFVIGNLRGR